MALKSVVIRIWRRPSGQVTCVINGRDERGSTVYTSLAPFYSDDPRAVIKEHVENTVKSIKRQLEKADTGK